MIKEKFDHFDKEIKENTKLATICEAILTPDEIYIMSDKKFKTCSKMSKKQVQMVLENYLKFAAYKGQIQKLKSFFEHKIDVINPKYKKSHALIEAVKGNQLEVVKLFLKTNINVNNRDITKHNALYYALVKNNQEIIKLLIQANIDLDPIMKIINELEKENDQLEKENDELEKENGQLEKENGQLKKELKNKQVENDQLKKEIKNLKQKEQSMFRKIFS